MSEWNTKITSIKPNEILIRGYAVEEIMEKLSYAEVVYLIIKGELPTPEEGRVFQAVLTSSVDHGVTPPSALATLNSTSTGAPLNAAVASGLLAINSFHGGAIEDSMKLYLKAAEFTGNTLDESKIEEFVKMKFEQKFKFPGFGHRVHTEDPRSIKLTELCMKNLPENKLFYIKLAKIIEEKIFTAKGIKLPVNVDGMIGAVLLALEIPAELANGIFMISRVPGLLAHYYEEKKTQKPMRNIDQKSAVYDGPSKRSI
ncbi:MAG TPA: citryl-CoA lyase [bacterium]|nr:citryl-CoA lyase [bacterium]HPS29301.1 citryl-CoA lyase [bacterium]